ncbi:MAG: hypothetical protein KAW09_01385, partial [Thermoplasmata archaeon]|nr:hypothetical protein [Thermoplasmata archaeon]
MLSGFPGFDNVDTPYIYPPYEASSFAGKVLLTVASPGKPHVPLSDPNISIERADYIGADGIMITLEEWWNDVQLYKDTLQQYKDANLLVTGGWGHHCEYERYCPRFNPPIQDWALANQ